MVIKVYWNTEFACLLVLIFYIEEECNDSFDYNTSCTDNQPCRKPKAFFYCTVSRHYLPYTYFVYTVLYNIGICLCTALIIRYDILNMFLMNTLGKNNIRLLVINTLLRLFHTLIWILGNPL